jgi:hypothetical protein
MPGEVSRGAETGAYIPSLTGPKTCIETDAIGDVLVGAQPRRHAANNFQDSRYGQAASRLVENRPQRRSETRESAVGEA